MKISTSSYSFQQYIREGKLTQIDTIEAAHKLGFEAIEFIDLRPVEEPTLEQQIEYAHKIREKADSLGMTVNAYTIRGYMHQETKELCDKEVERLKSQVDVAKIMGCSVLRHDVCYQLTKSGPSRSFDLMLPIIADNTRRVTEYAQTQGIVTCSENHGYIAQDSDRIERLVNAVNHENYGVLVDMGNFICADEDPVIAVSRLAPYAVHAHCKDLLVKPGTDPDPGEYFHTSRGGNFMRSMILGHGSVPVKQCIRILKKAGYDGYLSIEYEGKEDCMEGIRIGKANLERYIKEIEAENI